MSLLGPLRRIASGGALRRQDLSVPDLEHEGALAGMNLRHLTGE